MGQSQSSTPHPREVSTEQLSHELALRFAEKCFTHLEIAHFKDNIKTLADHQDGIEYWKEETLCQFLCLPDTLQAGSILYQMCTYLGAFPFPSLSPCILTREAMLKVVTIMSGRYKTVLKRGDEDKVKLLFRSLAVFDRRASFLSSTETGKPTMDELVAEQMPDDMVEENLRGKETRSSAGGFAIDQPSNEDEEEEDDDNLFLAALASLDAIEVFKQDQRVDRKINHAHIPVQNFRQLLTLLLLIAPLEPQEPLSGYASNLNRDHLNALERAATAILAAFEPDNVSKGIQYIAFVQAVSSTFPNLFDPLSALFEHFLFSKNIDLSKHKDSSTWIAIPEITKPSPIVRPSSESGTFILNDTTLSQISASISIGPGNSSNKATLFHNRAQFHSLYSTISHGTALSSFSRQVLSWQSSTLFLITGNLPSSETPITLGAYLPDPWTESSSTLTAADPSAPRPVLFQLSPRHAIFPANPYNRTTPVTHFSTRTGIAFGCVIPASSRTNAQPQSPILGPVSLSIDSDMSTAVFQHDGDAGVGAFLTDVGLEAFQRQNKPKLSALQRTMFEFEIDSLEVWGITFQHQGGSSEIEKQKKRLDWEEAEAARRRGVNFGEDKNGARALLEMAGIVGDDSHNRSGGSV